MQNENFGSKSRHGKNITAVIYLIFRGKNFEHNAEFGRKGHFANGSDDKINHFTGTGDAVSQTQPLRQRPKVRIINFSSIGLPAENQLFLDRKDVPESLKYLRKYADLPYVYVVSGKDRERISELLRQLQAIRSTCYPYALFLTEGQPGFEDQQDLDIITVATPTAENIVEAIDRYADAKFTFDKTRLKNNNTSPLPDDVGVLIVGGGITALYAAERLADKRISFCIVEKRDILGGIWSQYANSTSQVNTSEGAYRLIEKKVRSNRDHSSTSEVLEDLCHLSEKHKDSIFTQTEAEHIEKKDGRYQTRVIRNGKPVAIRSKGVILAVNDRVGTPRQITWENQHLFKGIVFSGISDESKEVNWQDKKVVIVGMGAFAIENTRTALENGASHVTVVCRRHGTVCPKIIDYLNFSTPYDDKFEHERKSNIRNMMLWKKLYDQSGATQPECWMGKIKHEGHTISVSDIWFIAHYLKKLETATGSITGLYEQGVVVDHRKKIEADIVVNCVGFLRNAPAVKKMIDYEEMYNNNYIDKDLMYLADAYIDDDVFNSFFGSSVLEMTKFYMDVYIDFFDNPEYEKMIQSDGIEKISINDRRWSHYIAGADALIKNYPRYYEVAKAQIDQRTANFHEAHDLETYIAENKREWLATHTLLNGAPLAETACLPYVFEKLIEKKNI